MTVRLELRERKVQGRCVWFDARLGELRAEGSARWQRMAIQKWDDRDSENASHGCDTTRFATAREKVKTVLGAE